MSKALCSLLERSSANSQFETVCERWIVFCTILELLLQSLHHVRWLKMNHVFVPRDDNYQRQHLYVDHVHTRV